MTQILIVVGLIAVIIILPIALFFGLIGLTLAIWSWRRIGPFFVNFGRWIANWRNLVPCSCIGCLSLILLLVVAPLILTGPLGILRLIGLVLLILIAVVFGTFALIVSTVRLHNWGWPRFRRWFWRFPPLFYDLVWRRIPEQFEKRMGGGSQPGKKTAARKPAPGPTASTGGDETKPAASAAVPKKRSRLDISWLWNLLWGKPQEPVKRKPKASVVSPEMQSQVVISTPEEAKTKVPKKLSRTGLRPLTWRLRLFTLWLERRMQRISGKPMPARKKTMGAQGKPSASAAPLADQSTPSVDGPGTKTQQTKAEPSKARGGPTAAVNFVRKRFWLAIFWVVEKVRTGVGLILRLLHLNGRKK